MLLPFILCLFLIPAVAEEDDGVTGAPDYSRINIDKIRAGLFSLRQRSKATIQAMPAKVTESGRLQRKPENRPRTSIKKHGDTLPEINQNAGLNDILYQGDMMLTEDQLATIIKSREGTTVTSRLKRQAYRDRFYPSTTWGTTLYYYFDPTATPKVQRAFRAAVAFWQANTCVNIVESATQPHRVRVFKGQGCYSYVGRVTGVQDLSLGAGCEEFGTAAHELGHALGFFHTQSRFDRDNYISINFNNIQSDYIEQFDKESSSTNYNYGMPYDYGSIMQYGATSASKNNKATMLAKDSEYQDTMGSDFVAFYDISMMNDHYSCKAMCPAATSAACKNGGFPSSRNCMECVCPTGYGGPLCDSRPAGCGQTLTATSSWQSFTDTVGDGEQALRENHTMCYYWLQGKKGQALQVRLASVKAVSIDGCIFGGVEIKANKDQNLTGYRFCSASDKGTVLTSESNLLPIITFNRYSKTTTVFEFRTIDGANSSPSETVTVAPSRCQDRHPNCAAYAITGFCTNFFYTIDARRYYCSKTCGFC